MRFAHQAVEFEELLARGADRVALSGGSLARSPYQAATELPSGLRSGGEPEGDPQARLTRPGSYGGGGSGGGGPPQPGGRDTPSGERPEPPPPPGLLALWLP